MKKKRSYAKQVLGLGLGSLGLAVGAKALGAVGGTSALHGQQALQNISKFAPAAGTIMGVALPIKIMHETFPKNKVKKIFK